MKIWLKIITIVVIFLTFALPVSAEERVDELISEFMDIIPEGVGEKLDSSSELTESVGFSALVREIVATVTGEGGRVFGFFLLSFSAVIFTAVAAKIPSQLSEHVSVAIGIVFCTLVGAQLGGVYSSLKESISEAGSFFAALIPLFASITALGGGAMTAGVQSVGMYTTLSLVGAFGDTVMLSVVGFGFAMGLLTAFGNEGAATVAGGVKSVFTWLLGILTTLISGTLALQTTLSSAADSAAMRAAKYAASGMIPVVGSTVSGALSTLASGLSYAKSFVGVGSIFALLSVLLSPLILLLLYRLSLSVSMIFSGFLGTAAASRMLASFRYSVDTMCALYSLSAVLYILEIVLFIKNGVALS